MAVFDVVVRLVEGNRVIDTLPVAARGRIQ